MPSLFNQSITNLKGVGSKRRELFCKLGVPTIGALLYYYPRTYINLSHTCNIFSAPFNTNCCVKARVLTPVSESIVRKNLSMHRVTVCSCDEVLAVTFFNNRFISDKLKVGEEFLFYGKVTVKNGMHMMTSPSVYSVVQDDMIHPTYHELKGLTSGQIASDVKAALSLIPDNIKEPIPKWVRDENKLPTLKFAVENIHFPKDMKSLELAKRYFLFEEYFALQLGLASIKEGRKKNNAHILENDYTNEFLQLLPFEATNAQKRVIDECILDMKKHDSSMNRLIQGDVGSGKTAVMAAVCFSVVKNGYQAAVMAPTEVLASQHFDFFKGMFSKLGIRIAYLVGSVPESRKKKIKDGLKNGSIDIVIGTHALISDNVQFSDLALVTTDEQHRFGVMQRTKLSKKGDNPHVLVMSATPIPRTLSFILYGDLDISLIDEMPKGRKAIKTFCVTKDKRDRVFSFLKRNIDEGNQGYVVCPAIESENLVSAKSYFESLKAGYFRDYKVGLLYGSMRSYDKECIMNKFFDGKIDILVATTVIEVGVNVPNATVMIIENADRFGLSQLHQLRGRIGRGNDESYCVLISDTQNEDTQRRLSVISHTNDGFKIADEDLKLRGPGDFLGERQHGFSHLKLSGISENIDLLISTKEIAQKILTEDRDLEDKKNKGLKALILRLFGSDYDKMKSF